MALKVATLSYVVRDYDEAISWFTGKLDFALVSDADQGGGKRWVVVEPKDGGGARLLLAKAVGETQSAVIGHQAGGRVFLFLETDNFDRDHAAMQSKGVNFLETPRAEPYGKVAVFEDLYGNRWDLLEPKP